MSRMLGEHQERRLLAHVHNIRPRPYDWRAERTEYDALCLSLLAAEGLKSDKPAVVEAATHVLEVML